MVRAIIEGRKTQTRRIVKFPDGLTTHNDWIEAHEIAPAEYVFWSGPKQVNPDFTRSVYKPGDGISCPYGQPGDNQWYSGMPPCDGWYYVQGEFNGKAVYLRPVPSGTYPDIEGDFITWGWDESDDPEDLSFDGGPIPETIRWKRAGDRLWVRETWQANTMPTGWPYYYRATDDDVISPPWKSPLFMPRVASRILLEITDARVERLRDITESDAKQEAAEYGYFDVEGKFVQPDKETERLLGECGSYRQGFLHLWQSIHGPESWIENPWVWVITFKKIEP